MIVFKFSQSKHLSKILRIPNMCLFFCSFSGCWVIINFVILHYIKVAKHIWHQCCHMAAATGSCFPLIKKECACLQILFSQLHLNQPKLNIHLKFKVDNGTVHFKNVNNCLNTNIYSYSKTSGGQNYNLHLNVVHFFNTSLN